MGYGSTFWKLVVFRRVGRERGLWTGALAAALGCQELFLGRLRVGRGSRGRLLPPLGRGAARGRAHSRWTGTGPGPGIPLSAWDPSLLCALLPSPAQPSPPEQPVGHSLGASPSHSWRSFFPSRQAVRQTGDSAAQTLAARMLLLLLGIIVLHVAVLVLLFVSTIVSVSVLDARTPGAPAPAQLQHWKPQMSQSLDLLTLICFVCF